MDDDLLEQLRTRHIKLGYELPTESLFSAAADEIERLRKALQEANRGLEIALCWSDNDGTWVAHEAVVKSSKAARAALAEKGEK